MDFLQLGIGVFNTAAIIAIYMYIQMREDKIRERGQTMHDQQEARIKENEVAIAAVRDNNVRQFREVREDIARSQVETLKSIHELDKTIRDTIHGLRTDIANAINK